MSESAPPPPSGGNLKYGIIGGVLLVAAVAVFFGMRGCEEEPPQGPVVEATPDAGTGGRDTALGDDELYIPDPEPDAGPVVDAGPRVRYVTRYVGGGGGNWNCTATSVPNARAVVTESNVQFRNCYERRLKANNQLEGRVTVQMRVSRTGAVDAVRTGGTMRDPEVLSCVRSVAQRLRFAPPTGGSCAVVDAPFNFTPRN